MNITAGAQTFAKEQKIALENVVGSGQDGRILKKDVENYITLRDNIRANTIAELAQNPQQFMNEIGVQGLDQFSGYINEAYIADLTWPTVAERYDKLRRSNPEISMIRQAFTTLGRDANITYEKHPDDDTPAHVEAVEYANTVLEDLDGGVSQFRDDLLSNVPFFGWGWWEVVLGIRSKSWRPPDKEDQWRSQFDDGMIGVRRLGWRSPTSFRRWEFTESGRYLLSMVQATQYGQEIAIPKNRSVHLTFGDPNNPEGLSPLEAVHRLERIKYALEFIFGRGMERSAGYAKFKTEKTISEGDKTIVRSAARGLMSAQENNYILLPSNIEAELIDTAFQSAQALLEAIKYYGVSILQIYSMQWIALSATTGAGSFAAMDDASGMFVQYFNAMLQGFAEQVDKQFTRFIFDQNDIDRKYAGMERLPVFSISKLEKAIAVEKLGSFIDTFMKVGTLGKNDIIDLRKASRFMREEIPEDEDVVWDPQKNRPVEQDREDAPPAQSEEDRELAVVDEEGEFTQYANDVIDRYDKRWADYAKLSGRDPVRVQLRAIEGDYPAQRANYRNTLKDVIADYLDSAKGTRITAFKNTYKQAVADNFIAAFVTGYLSASGGSRDDIAPEDRTWLASQQSQELSNVDGLFDSLREIKKLLDANDEDAPAIMDVAISRSNGYANKLDGIFNEGRLRGDKNASLIFGGDDGHETCATCQKWKGKRHRASFWIKRGLIPYPGNYNFECGGWRCQHGLFDRNGNKYTHFNVYK